ncbi:MAG TPA: hypothetical protein VMU18_03305 [Rhodoblastus sp.]|nr:hypothetical protein [Rhodoblastus sp.]
MSNEILKSMRALREEMRQRLIQAPEYRALIALDRSIEEISLIMQDVHGSTSIPAQPEPTPSPDPVSEAAQPARANAIATAFAETLAAKMDRRQVARPANGYIPGAHAFGG